jgi:anti-sigma-K factor RskA
LVTADRDADRLNRPADAGTGSQEGPPHDAVGAYVLDALPEAERAAFEEHLATCASCRREVAQLTPVVALLPRLLELDPETDRDADVEAVPVPSPDLRDRILEAVRADQRPAVANASPAEPVPVRPVQAGRESPFAPEEPIAFPPPRPRGMVRGGVAGSGRERGSPWETMGRWSPGWLAAAVLGIVAVGAIVWALTLMGTIDDKNREIAGLRGQANASAWHLAPGGGNRTGQSGTLLYSLNDKTGALVVTNMPPLPANKVYQSWLIRGTGAPVPGATFTVDDHGQGAVPVDPKAPTFNVVAVTEEPAGGSAAPTSPILLQGQLSGAAGALPGVGIAAVRLSPPQTDGNS